jgi:hypothetical protein
MQQWRIDTEWEDPKKLGGKLVALSLFPPPI